MTHEFSAEGRLVRDILTPARLALQVSLDFTVVHAKVTRWRKPRAFTLDKHVREAHSKVRLYDAKHGPQISPRQDPEKFHAARERRKRSMAYGNAVSPKGKSPGTRKGKAAGGFF